VSTAVPTDAPGHPLSRLPVLFVCTGNVCRSPVAAWAWERALDGRGVTAQVSTAGHGALVGASPDPLAEAAAREAGLTPRTHRARQLAAADVQAAHVVLALDRDGRRAAVELVPRASRYSFTLIEFGRLVTDLVASGTTVAPDGIVAAAASRRGFAVGPRDLRDDDVPDPYGRLPRRHAEAVTRIVAETERVVEAVMLLSVESPVRS
jgi:protein-tyrosine phosphatase